MAVANIFRVVETMVYTRNSKRPGRMRVEHMTTSDSNMNTMDQFSSPRRLHDWFDVPAVLSSVDNEWVFITKAP